MTTVHDLGAPAAASGAPTTARATHAASPPSPPRTVAPFVVAGWGTALPPTIVTNRDLEARLDTTDAWIRERSGIAERRLASPGHTTAGLATDALRTALDRAHLDLADLDVVVVATSTPELPMPPTASLVAAALAGGRDGTAGAGTAGPGTVDLNGACAGFPYALSFAAGQLATGQADTVAVVAAETMSRIIDPEDRSTAVLFGDGAAAVILSQAGQDDRGSGGAGGWVAGGVPGLLAIDLVSDPGGADLLTVPAGGAARPASEATVAAREHYMRMDGREVFRRAVRAVVDSVGRTLSRAGVSAADVDVFVPHQANVRIVDAVLHRTGIDPDHTLGNIERLGNTSAASIPMVLAEAAGSGRPAPGDLVLLTGFGAGLTVGTALVRWGIR
ncbi:MAG TPA: beta-ketoacyl-ACP synthase III [Acidimicrobiales bacterium]|nr:beta-ketoacyl-ACP synthase III [Acidimicrobiales bacterium]